jgi:hypothetical protein
MFRRLAQLIPVTAGVTPADRVFAIHPLQLSRWLEEMWANGGLVEWESLAVNPLHDPSVIARNRIPPGMLSGLASGIGNNAGLFDVAPFGFDPPPAPGTAPLGGGQTQPWDHLIYAYLVESTGVFEILGEVVRRYVVGETLPTPSSEALMWVRSTEQLFFRDPPLFGIVGVSSHLRPDEAANRRNAYRRMFGIELPHPLRGVEGQPWRGDIGDTTNERFLELWNELLRQVWLAIEHERNTSGANPTDSSYIGYLCQALGEMLQMRRRKGMLSREEFAYVTMLSWFHLTVEYDSALVDTLSATAGARGNPSDRLALIGARVGMSPSRQSRELFELANSLSGLFWLIELGKFNTGTAAELLYKINTPPANVAKAMNRIIDLWQSATGQRVKDAAVGVRGAAVLPPSQPIRLLPTTPAPVAPTRSTNGHRRGQPVPHG